MQAIEFDAHLKDGVIRLPTSYRHWREGGPVKVIVLADDDEGGQPEPRDASRRFAEIMAASRRCATSPGLDPRDADQIVRYDPSGLPT